MLKLDNFVKVKVEQLENKNQFVIFYKDNTTGRDIIAFQSYKTLIAIYSNITLYVNWRYWDYSKTTLKHLKMFVDRYTCFDYENKQHFLKLITQHPRVVAFEE